MEQVEKYGRLTVLNKVGRKWLCECDCGNTKEVDNYDLRRGHTKSCGCYRSDTTRKRKTIHGDAVLGEVTRIYRIWRNMHNRCYDKKGIEKFQTYRDKGITVCLEWREYAPFKEWALNNGYKDSLTLDRIDNGKGYYPDNCGWTDYETQAYNRSNTIRINIKGEDMTIKEVSTRYGISPSVLRDRYRSGDMDDRLIRPVRKMSVKHG